MRSEAGLFQFLDSLAKTVLFSLSVAFPRSRLRTIFANPPSYRSASIRALRDCLKMFREGGTN